MKITYKATIYFDCKANHPDAPNEKGHRFTDVYTFDTDTFSGGNDREAMQDYMREDLALIAGGGYRTNTISRVRYNIINISK